MNVAGEHLAARRLEALGAAHDDVLADLRDELGTNALERFDRVRPVGLDARENARGELPEVQVGRDRLALAADGDHRGDASLDALQDDALVGGSRRPLAGLRHSLFAQELAGRVEVSVGFLQRPLAVHHPRAGLLAQFFHQAGRDLSHCADSFSSFDSLGAGSGLAGAFSSTATGFALSLIHISEPTRRTPISY